MQKLKIMITCLFFLNVYVSGGYCIEVSFDSEISNMKMRISRRSRMHEPKNMFSQDDAYYLYKSKTNAISAFFSRFFFNSLAESYSSSINWLSSRQDEVVSENSDSGDKIKSCMELIEKNKSSECKYFDLGIFCEDLNDKNINCIIRILIQYDDFEEKKEINPEIKLMLWKYYQTVRRKCVKNRDIVRKLLFLFSLIQFIEEIDSDENLMFGLGFFNPDLTELLKKEVLIGLYEYLHDYVTNDEFLKDYEDVANIIIFNIFNQYYITSDNSIYDIFFPVEENSPLKFIENIFDKYENRFEEDDYIKNNYKPMLKKVYDYMVECRGSFNTQMITCLFLNFVMLQDFLNKRYNMYIMWKSHGFDYKSDIMSFVHWMCFYFGLISKRERFINIESSRFNESKLLDSVKKMKRFYLSQSQCEGKFDNKCFKSLYTPIMMSYRSANTIFG